MKKYLVIQMFFIALITNAQNYNNIVNYSISGTPAYGVKIKTNMPFIPMSQMPTITITGYNYNTSEPINLTLVYYIYFNGSESDPSGYYFHFPKVSSSGSYTPQIYLSNENGKVVIFINDKVYYQRFTVSTYAKGMGETNDWFQGWTAVDEPMTGTQTIEVPYQNRFKGNIFLSGNSIWNADGNVGIGTTSPDAKLAVNGTIHSKEVKVDSSVPAPDYVFANNYKLRTLQEVESYISKHSHLPEIPSAKEFDKNGIYLAEMNMALLKKVEELTLYAIDQNKRLEAIEKENKSLKNEIRSIKKK
ncbi:hypothetical protein [Flavobacterium sp. C3NV]|uniref:hypothetical protein n=1 Tax=Flavobacterium sp. C3NV TaxID=3393358 RepID=UPI00398FA3A5